MKYWITVVDDDELYLTNARTILSAENMRVSCLRSGNDLLKFIEKNSPDLVLLDVMMPGMDGFTTYNELRKIEAKIGRPNIPVIFLTGENDSEIEQQGLRLGASDFIRKPFFKDILVKRIENTINSRKVIEVLTEEAMFDKLTGFLNKARGTERVSKLCIRKTGALMIMDLDNFKLVNDLFGHDMGDRMLTAFAGIIKRNTRETDTISRIGGDEFMAFYEDMVDESAVASLTKRLNSQIVVEAAKLMGEDNGIPLGITIGCVFVPEQGRNYEALFSMADNALYFAKQNGKHGYSVFNEPSKLASGEEDNLKDKLDRIIRTLEERYESEAALFLGRESFATVYRFIMRYNKIYGGAVAFILLSLKSSEKLDNKIIQDNMHLLETVLQKRLKLDDIAMQSSSDSYFIMLPNCTYDRADNLAKEIASSFEKDSSSLDVKIEYTTRIDEINKKD